MKLKYTIKIDTILEIKNKEDLKKLKNIVEANKLEKPNFSKLSRELKIDRRTIKKYYEGNEKKERKGRKTKIDTHYEIIKELLGANSIQKFNYKIHLYRYLKREHNLEVSRSNFNAYILRNKEFAEYFNPKTKKEAVKTETPFGKQAQFDWKEKLKFTFKDGSEILINVGSIVLSASRYKIWKVCPSTSQDYLFDFLTTAFERIGGVPEELIVDNASTIMDKARTEKSEGKVNIKFEQFAKDFNFKVKPCMRARPNTKAKVENPMRIIEEILNYNGKLENLTELDNKLSIIEEEANSRICQGTGIPPILLYKKEKENILKLPNEKIMSYYKIKTNQVIVNTDGLFTYNKKQYSVPVEYIGKRITLKVIESQIQVYFNTKLITMHNVSEKKINYHEKDHFEMLKKTSKKIENLEEAAINHLKELEVFNEQLSEFI